jgi:hypothetical protein
MKNRFFNIYILLIAVLLFACTENKNEVSKGEPVAQKEQQTIKQSKETKSYSDTLNADAIALRMNAGDKFEMIISSDEKLSGVLSDETDKVLQQQSLKQINKISYDCRIADVSENGNFSMDITFARIINSIDAETLEKSSFDSRNYKDVSEVPANYMIPFSLIGKTYRVTLSPLGKLIKIENITELTKAVKEQLSSTKFKGKQIEEILNKEFDFDKLYNFFSRLFNYADGKVHKQKEIWRNRYRQNLDKPLTVKAEYEIVNVSKSILKIKTKGKLTDSQPNETINNGTITIKKQAEGTLSGTIIIDAKTGLIRESEITQILNTNEEQRNRNKPDKILHSKLKRVTKHKVIVKQKNN